MATSDILKGLATAAAGELAKSATSKAKGTASKSSASKSSATTKKTTTTKKVTAASKTTKSGLGDLVGSIAGNFDISSLLTGAVTSAVTNNVAQSALGFTDVNGDGKIDISDILQSIVKAVQGGKIDIKSLSSTITNVWNTAFKAGQESKK